MFKHNPIAGYASAVRNYHSAKARAKEASQALADGATAEEIAAILWQYHRSKQALSDAWQRLAEHERRVLQPPEHYFVSEGEGLAGA